MRNILVCLSAVLLFTAACGGDENPTGKFTLTVVKSGTGSGTVTGGALACGATCTATVDSGAALVLTAVADSSSQFTSWAGCDSATSNVCTLTVSANRTVTATFTAVNRVLVSADLTAATTWTTGTVYEVTRDVTAKAPLIIQPGVHVLFDTGASLRANSTITADAFPAGAAAANPIVFTSAQTSPAAGDWEGISLAASGSLFNYCTFTYAGGTTAALDLGAYAATVTNSIFAHNRATNETVRSVPALDASDAAAATVVTGNTFFDNTVALSINTTYSFADSNLFSGSDTGGAAVGNKYQAVIVRGCGQVTSSITWSLTKVPLLIGNPIDACGYVTIAAGGHLTIADGAIIKLFPGGRIDVSGVLTANATAGTFFTAYADDAHGGDTNADAAGSAPAPGDWNGLSLASSGSLFNHVSFLFGGGATDGGNVPVLYLGGSKSVTVTNSTFAHTRPSTSTVRSPPALDVSDGMATGTVVTGNLFYDDTVPLGINATQSLDDSNTFALAGTASSTFNGVFVAGCGAVTAATTWSVTKVPLVIGDPVDACNYLDVAGGGHLTLGPNLVMKFFGQGRVNVAINGLLTVDATDWLTCIADDKLGDTNADGSATWPAAGDWYGIKYSHSGSNPTCDESAYMHWQTPNKADHSCNW